MWWFALEIPVTLSWKSKGQLTLSAQQTSRNKRDSLNDGWSLIPSKSSPGSLGESWKRDLALENQEEGWVEEPRYPQTLPDGPVLSNMKWNARYPGKSQLQPLHWDATFPKF